MIPGSWTFDLDGGVWGPAAGADFQWELYTADQRSLVPQNGASYFVIGPEAWENVGYADCAGALYSWATIQADKAGPNQMPANTVICYVTNDGRMGKFRVDEYVGDAHNDLLIRWVTWSGTETVNKAPVGDDIRHIRVTRISDTELVVDVHYTYASDHGDDRIMMLARPLMVPGMGFRPGSVQRGHGFTSVSILQTGYAPGCPPPPSGTYVSPQIEVCMYGGEQGTFYCEAFGYESIWHW